MPSIQRERKIVHVHYVNNVIEILVSSEDLSAGKTFWMIHIITKLASLIDYFFFDNQQKPNNFRTSDLVEISIRF